MRIRNRKSYALGLSYAGARKGYTLKPGGLSPELPADRFYHPQLQTDWKRGYIDVLLSDMDKAALGASVNMFSDAGEVNVLNDTVVPGRPQPKPTSPTAETVKEVLKDRAAATTEATNAYNDTKEAAAATKETEPETDPDWAEPVETFDDGPDLCQRQGCKTIDKKVLYDERVNFFLCQHCRQQVTRRRNAVLKDEPDAMISELYNRIATDMGLGMDAATPELPPEDPNDGSDDYDDDSPVQLGYGLSLSDLNK